MKIAILGNGRMGKRISELAIQKGHTIVCNSSSEKPASTLNLSTADLAIDFSTPTTAFENISHAINSGIPVVSGTTGWLKNLAEIEDLCKAEKGAFLYSSNFSLGMNILFEINKTLAKLMKNQNYESSLNEIHHTKKLDSPSGTAKTLGKQMDNILANSTPITAERIGDVPGTHIIKYTSTVDEIEIKHTAKNRDGFAIGALIAGKWIIGKQGIFSMQDVLTQ
ncbi:MAG: 4-hydroxy-tetrahydrodipicolinate reductase [Cryomorphaceae bacterium]|nr:MAG: 4-hydroxy-tetrahydrodipicolinate reductase [Cryomorphaceae bacterium]